MLQISCGKLEDSSVVDFMFKKGMFPCSEYLKGSCAGNLAICFRGVHMQGYARGRFSLLALPRTKNEPATCLIMTRDH